MNYKTVIWVIVLSWVVFGFNQKQDLPEGFVYVTSEIPDLDVELRYYGTNNFIGDKSKLTFIEQNDNNRLSLHKVPIPSHCI